MICLHNIIAIAGLAIRASIAYKNAPDTYQHISEEVAALKLLVDKAAPHFKGTTISQEGYHYGEQILKDCQSVLEGLNSFIEKYQRLASINERLVCNRVKLGKDDITDLHVRLVSNTGLLNEFIRSCEYGETQAQLAALLGTNSTISLTSIAAFAANTNTEMAFEQFCKGLYRIGVPEDLIQKNQDTIRDILKSQGMVAKRQIGSSETGDKDQALETAYKEYCKNLYDLGFTEDLMPPKSRVLKILKSRGVVASSVVASSQSRGGVKDNNSSTKVLPSFRLSSRVNWFESSSGTGSLVPEATNEDNSPPLQLPPSNNHSVVELLSGKGSSIKIIDQKNTTTPLHLAAGGGYTGLVELLLSNTPSNLATLKGHTSALELLLFGKGAPIEAMDKYYNTPLHLATWNGHADIVDLLLRKGASIEARNLENKTPLHFAAQDGYTGTVELLLEKGASVEAMELHNNTPLHLAAWNGHTNIVELPLEKGSSIEAMDNNNNTLLHLAVWNGHADIVELLLEKGASIEAMNTDNKTPLHFAARDGYTGTVELLLEKGASIDALDKQEHTALYLAAWGGHTGTVELLLKTGASIDALGKGNTALHLAAWGGQSGAVDFLLKNGASIEAKGLDDRTPLHYAAQEGYTKLVELLLERGASTEARNRFNKTPLHMAAERGHTDTVKLLKNKASERAHGNRA